MEAKLKLIIFSVLLNVVVLQICRRENQNCTGLYDIYNTFKTQCKKYECFGKFNFKCGEENCAIDEKSCFYFEALNSNLLRIIKGPKAYEETLKMNEKALEMIKTCPSPSYKWNPKNVCIRNNNCILKHKFPFLNKMFSTNRKIKCICDNKHSYQCMANYCTVNKLACDALVSKLSVKSNINTAFSTCNNLYKTIERKILF